MSEQDAERAAGRAPRQARGRERRESIIDAAAAIVAAQGVEALTLHTAARRAGASIGSMYHFFQSREALLEALNQRHRLAVTAMTEEARQIPPAQWRRMPVPEVIERLFGRSVGYFAQHRDALALIRLDDSPDVAEFQALLRKVMQLRLGEERGSQAAATLFAVCTGTQFFLRDLPSGDEAAASEIPRVLSAYLADLERSARRATEDELAAVDSQV